MYYFGPLVLRTLELCVDSIDLQVSANSCKFVLGAEIQLKFNLIWSAQVFGSIDQNEQWKRFARTSGQTIVSNLTNLNCHRISKARNWRSAFAMNFSESFCWQQNTTTITKTFIWVVILKHVHRKTHRFIHGPTQSLPKICHRCFKNTCVHTGHKDQDFKFFEQCAITQVCVANKVLHINISKDLNMDLWMDPWSTSKVPVHGSVNLQTFKGIHVYVYKYKFTSLLKLWKFTFRTACK